MAATRVYTINENYFKKIDSEDKAYFLGLLYADGQNHEEGNYIRLQLQKDDKHILDDFQKHLKSDYKIMKLELNKKRKEWSDAYYLQINSKRICKDLSKLGCHQNKTYILNFPSERQVPEAFVSHFIRGYFDGNGSVWEGKRVRVLCKDAKHKNGERVRIIHNVKFNITGSSDMIKSIQNVLVAKLNFKQNKLNKSKRIISSLQLEYSGRKQMATFYDFLYKNSTVFFLRKKDKFESILKFMK